MKSVFVRSLLGVAGLGLLAGCVAPSASPQAVRRLPPEALARLEPPRESRPLSLDEIVQASGRTPPSVLIDLLRRSGTHHALSPSQVLRLREQGVAPEVLDEITAAEARRAQDQASAERVRRATEQAAALERARADAAERAYPNRFDPSWPYAYPGYPLYPGYPGHFGYSPRGPYPGPRFGWGLGVQIGR